MIKSSVIILWMTHLMNFERNIEKLIISATHRLCENAADNKFLSNVR